MNDFLGLSMYNSEKHFFSNTIFEEKVILDLLVNHYLYIPRWKRICNNGLILDRRKNGFKNQFAEDTVWLQYKEKFSGRVMLITYDGTVEIVQREKTIFAGGKINRETINQVKDIISLTEEIEKLVSDYLLILEYEGFERIYHPVRRESFEQRDNVVKIIILFCLIGGGLSARQLIHITNVIQEFEISSELACVAFQKADLLKKREKEKAFLILVNRLSDNVKGYTLKDIIYLFELGDFFLEQEERIYRIIQNCFQIEKDELDKYRYIIKRGYINE